MLLRAVRFLLLLLLALAAAGARAQGFAAIPPLTAHVTDNAGMLSAGQRASLENVLTEYEARTGSQIAILLVKSTEPEAIEQYAIRVADAWKIGRKGVDDGVILVVAKDNPKALRRLRIEAGRGVQGVLTDVQSKRILQDVIAPHFRQNDFYGGLAAGISAITSLLDQEKFAPPGQRRSAQEDDSSLADLLPMAAFLFFIVMALARRGGRRRGVLSDNAWGNAAGIIIGHAIGSRMGHHHRGGGFGSFGGGGGGFSGGGGGFDGGGASGDW